MAGAIRFGASVSVSGSYAVQGRQVLAGLGAWVEAVNDGEGLRVHGAGARARVRLVYYDDASSPAKAAANAERLLDADAVEVLIGPYASDLTRAVLPVAGRRGRVLWNHGGASDDIHLEGGRAVGILTPVSRYFGGLIELARSFDPDAVRVALLHRRGSSFGHLAALGVGLRRAMRYSSPTSSPTRPWRATSRASWPASNGSVQTSSSAPAPSTTRSSWPGPSSSPGCP